MPYAVTKPTEADSADPDDALDLYLIGGLEMGKLARTALSWKNVIDKKWWCTLVGCRFYGASRRGIAEHFVSMHLKDEKLCGLCDFHGKRSELVSHSDVHAWTPWRHQACPKNCELAWFKEKDDDEHQQHVSRECPRRSPPRRDNLFNRKWLVEQKRFETDSRDPGHFGLDSPRSDATPLLGHRPIALVPPRHHLASEESVRQDLGGQADQSLPPHNDRHPPTGGPSLPSADVHGVHHSGLFWAQGRHSQFLQQPSMLPVRGPSQSLQTQFQHNAVLPLDVMTQMPVSHSQPTPLVYPSDANRAVPHARPHGGLGSAQATSSFQHPCDLDGYTMPSTLGRVGIAPATQARRSRSPESGFRTTEPRNVNQFDTASSALYPANHSHRQRSYQQSPSVDSPPWSSPDHSSRGQQFGIYQEVPYGGDQWYETGGQSQDSHLSRGDPNFQNFRYR